MALPLPPMSDRRIPPYWRGDTYPGAPGTGIPTIPNWVPPDDSGRPSAEDLNSLARAPRQTVAAMNTVIPEVYGLDRLFGKPFVIHVDEAGGFLYVAYGFCNGEIQSFENIFIDNEEAGADGGFLESGGVITAYLGTQAQVADPTLASVIPGYADACKGLAYLVLKCPKDTTRGFPRVEAIIKGRKVYDPRKDSTNGGSGSHLLSDTATWEWSNNPALCCADFAYRLVGWGVDWASVAETANANDELVGGNKRREIGLTMDQAATAQQWLQGFRTYMGAFVTWEGGVLRFIPDRADVDAPYGLLFNRDRIAAPYGYAEGTYTALHNVGSASFSVSASIKPDKLGVQQEMLSRYTTSAAAGWFFALTAANALLVYMVNTGGTNYSATSAVVPGIAVNKTMRVGADINRTLSSVQFYVDGVALGAPVAVAVTGSLDTASAPIRVGGLNTTTRPFFGVLDEVQLWTGLLGAGHLTYLLKEVADVPANLIAYYKLNELTGARAKDSSASNIPLTLVGSPAWTLGDTRIIPKGVAFHFTADTIREGGLTLNHRVVRSHPNTLIVEYVDSSANPWRRERVQVSTARVEAGLDRPRASRISLPGIHLASQAYREAVERLNWFLSDLEGTMTVFDEGMKIQNGSVIAVTHPIGLVAKLFRVRRVAGDTGRWTLDLAEYDPAMYSNAVITSPTTPDVVVGNPLRPPPINDLSAFEELFKYRNGLTGSRVRITWTSAPYAFLSQYVIEGYVNGTLVFQTSTLGNEAVTPGVEELVSDSPVTYEVRVSAQSAFSLGVQATTSILIQGKLAPPSDVPALTLTQIAADQVSLRWEEATDIDIWLYEVRVGDGSSTWATATKLELVDGLNYTATGVGLGTWRYFVKARDSVGNESVNAVMQQLTVAAPVGVASLNGFEVGGTVRLSWAPPAGAPYIARYRVAFSDIPQTYERTLDVVDTLTFSTAEVAEGTYTFKVYAIDGAGRETSAPATRVIEVSSDTDAFLADTYEFASPTLTNMAQFSLRTDSRKFYVTSMGNVFLSSPSSFTTYSASPLANYHTSGSGEWLSETRDFGLLLTGNWVLEPAVQALSGTVTVALELSTNNIAWDVTTGTGQVSAKGEYRYARVRITTATTSTAYVIAGTGIGLAVKVVPLEESGTVASLGSGAATVTLSRTYTALKEIVVTPVGYADALTAVVDNVIMGNPTSFDVYVFDVFGQQLARNVQWKFKAV